MQTDGRITREKNSYDEGNVWDESHKIHLRFHHLFSCPNTLYGESFFESKLAELCKGQKVLDYGCSDGGLAAKCRSLGAARIVGIDISEKGISKARAAFGGIGEFHVCDAHEISIIGEGEMDVVVGRAILHHLDFETAIHQIIRVLRPGGNALFAEPLYDNPVSKLFRRMTPKARTLDEKPLMRKQIEWADTCFSTHTPQLQSRQHPGGNADLTSSIKPNK